MLIPNSKWERRQQKNFKEKSEHLQGAIKKGTDQGYNNFEDFTEDLFSSIYQVNPKFPEEATPGTDWAKNALDEMKDLKDYATLRNKCDRCDSFHAGLGSTVLAEHFSEILPKVTERNPDDIQEELENLKEIMKNMPKGSKNRKQMKKKVEEVQDALQMAKKDWKQASGGMEGHTIRQALRKGLQKAEKEISDLEDGMAAFGWGTGDGSDSYGQDSEFKMKLAKRLKENRKLQEVAKLAGRMRREAKHIQANKASKTPTEVTTVECGNNIDRLLPFELAKLGHPIMKKLFYKGLLERDLVQYKVEGVEKKQRGPIVVCVDNSGSMSGAKEYWSKAVCLAMTQIAADTKRTVMVIHFDSSVRKTYTFEKGNLDPVKILEMCEYFAGGGTNFDDPLRKAFTAVKDHAVDGLEKADVVLISDGMCGINEDLKTAIKELERHTGASLYSIIFGHVSDELRELSSEVYEDVDLSKDDEIKETLFSI